MKAIFAPFPSLLAIAALFLSAHPTHSADINTEASVFAFKSCSDVVKKTGTAAENFDHKKLTIRKGYTVDLYVAKVPPSPRKTDIVVWIEDGPGLKPENPRITAVCVGKDLVAPLPNEPPGSIDFHSAPGDNITIRFHLDNLKLSKWKKDTTALANDSVMMKEFPEGTTPVPKPVSGDWPDCAKPKAVAVSDDPKSLKKDTDISFKFSRCANPGPNNIVYEYRLVMDQYPPGGGAPKDYPIDPIIINRP